MLPTGGVQHHRWCCHRRRSSALGCRFAEHSIADGNVLLFNIHISKQCVNPIFLPNNDVGLPDDDAWRLFHMSSPLPTRMLQIARVEEIVVAEGARGFAFNADVVSLVRLINIGTQVRPAGA